MAASIEIGAGNAGNLARDLVWALDPARFALEALGMNPDAWQERVLRWMGKRLILNITRQGGKSTTTAALALHTSLYQPESLVLLVSPSLRQSGELFRKVTSHLGKLEKATGARPRMLEENKLSMQLENGSRVVSLPSSEETIRGFSAVDLLIEDEASRVSDDLNRAVRPMLAVSQGRLVLMSSPFGKRGHFYEAWERGGPQWDRVKVTAYECPRITSAFLAEERAALGELWFKSEYLCEFADTVDSAFSPAAVKATVSDEVAPLFGAPDTDASARAGEGAGEDTGQTGAMVAPLFE